MSVWVGAGRETGFRTPWIITSDIGCIGSIRTPPQAYRGISSGSSVFARINALFGHREN